MQESVLTPQDLQAIGDIAAKRAEETVTALWSGQANLATVTPDDLHYRGKGVYYSPSEGWFAKGPGGSLMHLPGAPSPAMGGV